MVAGNLWIVLGIVACAGVVASIGVILAQDGAGLIEQDERASAEREFTRFVDREIGKAKAGAANADQWAKDLVTEWSKRNVRWKSR